MAVNLGNTLPCLGIALLCDCYVTMKKINSLRRFAKTVTIKLTQWLRSCPGPFPHSSERDLASPQAVPRRNSNNRPVVLFEDRSYPGQAYQIGRRAGNNDVMAVL